MTTERREADLPPDWLVELTAFPDLFRVNMPGERVTRVRRFWHELSEEERIETRRRAHMIGLLPRSLGILHRLVEVGQTRGTTASHALLYRALAAEADEILESLTDIEASS